MGSFGEKLRREREDRGITLEDISRSTKISVRLLQAIEDEAFDRLPGGVFNVNFVRQYARHIGIDADRTVSEFRAVVGEPGEAEVYAGALDRPQEAGAEYEWDPERQGRVRTWATVALAVVAIAAGAVLLTRERHVPPPVAEASPTASAPSPPAAAQPVPEPKVEPPPPEVKPAPPPVAAEPSEPVRVEMLATDKVWVSATADGKALFVTTLEANQQRVAAAQNRLRLRVGNAGALKVTFNGQEQPALGPLGFPRTVIFTPDGMHVAPPPADPDAEPAPKETP
jgi:cytoskeletal protein RodZ